MTVETVYFMGTGIAEGSWPPIIRAIHKAEITGTHLPKEGDVTAANSFLLWTVGLRRHYQEMSEDQTKPELAARAADKLPDLAEMHRRLKSCMADELHLAADMGSLRLRDQFMEIVSSVGPPGSCAFLTTNWDHLLERLFLKHDIEPKVAHLHGDITKPNLMLLPGEVIREPYRRNEAERKAMVSSLMGVWTVFHEARRLVIYGHSLSTMEADLRVVLGMGLSESEVEEIIIVDRASQLETIRSQLVPMLSLNCTCTVTGRAVEKPSEIVHL